MRTLLSVLGRLVLLVSVLLTLDRMLDLPVGLLAALATLATWAVPGYLLALALMLFALRGVSHRRRIPPGAAMLATVGLLLHAVWLAPLYVGGTLGGDADLTVMTSNQYLGQGDSTTLVRVARSTGVDVMVLEEVTPEQLSLLEGEGLSARYPYRAGAARPRGDGTMVFSRYALSDETPIPQSHTGLEVTVAAPLPFRLLAAHTGSPVNGMSAWSTDLRTLRAFAHASVRSGPTVLAGDLNATRDNAAFRRLLGEGLGDARAQSNAGRQPTWPTRYRRSYLRPLIPIDHVLVGPGYSAVGVQTYEIPGSDHRAVVARLVLT